MSVSKENYNSLKSSIEKENIHEFRIIISKLETNDVYDINIVIEMLKDYFKNNDNDNSSVFEEMFNTAIRTTIYHAIETEKTPKDVAILYMNMYKDIFGKLPSAITNIHRSSITSKSLVFAIDQGYKPSIHDLEIFAGRYQSSYKIRKSVHWWVIHMLNKLSMWDQYEIEKGDEEFFEKMFSDWDDFFRANINYIFSHYQLRSRDDSNLNAFIITRIESDKDDIYHVTEKVNEITKDYLQYLQINDEQNID